MTRRYCDAGNGPGSLRREIDCSRAWRSREGVRLLIDMCSRNMGQRRMCRRSPSGQRRSCRYAGEPLSSEDAVMSLSRVRMMTEWECGREPADWQSSSRPWLVACLRTGWRVVSAMGSSPTLLTAIPTRVSRRVGLTDLAGGMPFGSPGDCMGRTAVCCG